MGRIDFQEHERRNRRGGQVALQHAGVELWNGLWRLPGRRAVHRLGGRWLFQAVASGLAGAWGFPWRPRRRELARQTAPAEKKI